MKVTYLGAESLGARSVATLVETKELKILIDPGVSLGPSRYSLPPHPLEYKSYERQWAGIKDSAKKADVIVISHYHYDHYNPFEALNIYKDKLLIVKHPLKDINKSQAGRAKKFLSLIKDLPESIEYAEGFEFNKGSTKILMSPPFPHGNTDKLGCVVMTKVTDNKESFIHSSDVEGPTQKRTSDWIIEQNPNTLWLDGLATIFLGWMHPMTNLLKANKNGVRILNETSNLKSLVLEHHLLRDLKYKEKCKPIFDAGITNNKKVLTSAEFMNGSNEFLEANRAVNWKDYKPKKFEPPRKEIFSE